MSRGSYLCCMPSVAGWDGAGGRGSGAAVRVERDVGCAACAGRGAPCVAVGAGRGTGAARGGARAGSVQHAEGAGCAGRVGCEGHHVERGAVCEASHGQEGLGQDERGALGHCWLSGCWGDCWVGCSTDCSEW